MKKYLILCMVCIVLFCGCVDEKPEITTSTAGGDMTTSILEEHSTILSEEIYKCDKLEIKSQKEEFRTFLRRKIHLHLRLKEVKKQGLLERNLV